MAAHHDAARLRQVEPLVRVHRARVGSFQPGEELGPNRGRGKAVRAVDVEPDPGLIADVRDRVEVIHRAGQRRARRRDHRDGRVPDRAIGRDRLRQYVWSHPAQRVERDRA